MGGEGLRSRKVFVANLAAATTEEDLKEHFTRYGAVVDVHLVRDSKTKLPQRYGYVTFAETDSAEAAFVGDNHLNGRLMSVQRYDPKGGKYVVSADRWIL